MPAIGRKVLPGWSRAGQQQSRLGQIDHLVRLSADRLKRRQNLSSVHSAPVY